MVETDIRTEVEQEVAALPEEALPTVLALIRSVRQRPSDSEHLGPIVPTLAFAGMAADLSDEEFDMLLSMYHQRGDDTAIRPLPLMPATARTPLSWREGAGG